MTIVMTKKLDLRGLIKINSEPNLSRKLTVKQSFIFQQGHREQL